ncbi:MAG: PocR ligand-binding domain-containing protein [Clostridium sp.]|nr:PocR ligand-binding domain-containing protein [Clostridium sp.]
MKYHCLTELIDISILQQIQDTFSEFTGMAAWIIDEEGRPVTKESGFSDFCMCYIRKSAVGSKRCEECNRQAALLTMNEGKAVVFQCHAGLVEFAVPIMVEERLIGTLLGGGVSARPLDMEQIRANAHELEVDEEEYVEAASHIAIAQEGEVNRAAEFLYRLGGILSSIAYKRNGDVKKSRKLERAAKSQADFVMDMNTEFQNNMKEWIYSAKEALESRDLATMEESIRQLLVEGPSLLSSLSDTVAYARMTDGKIVLNETMYNIEKLMEFVCYNVEEQLEDKAVVIIRQVDDNVPSKLLGDQGKIGQVINRLLMNAIQHMDEGMITIHVSSETSGYAENLTIRISDTGIDMTQEDYEYVDRYLEHEDIEFLDDQEEDDIGLSMVSFLLKQMSGSIEVERMEEKGTAFVVRLPQLKLA